MKRCFKCHQERPLTEFYKHMQMGDKHLGKCKECTKKDARETRKKRIDYYRAYDVERFTNDPRRRAENYAKNKRNVAANPHKNKARVAVNNAVRDGRLKKFPCEVCGRKDSHGHHDDYGKPLEVRWLCPVHHSEAHRLKAPIP